MELASVAAIADNLVIGRNGEIPWKSLPEDKAMYRARVADDPVILGRRTFESMLDDLPGRIQIVLSRTPRTYDVATAHPVTSIEEALATAGDHADGIAYVIGGAAIYDLFLPHLDRMYLTRVTGEYEGDAVYPSWDLDEWDLLDTSEYEGFRVEEWVRVRV